MADTIVLKSTGSERYDDAVADATITPGDLLNITATGVIRHATAAGNAVPIFAVNASDQNKGIDDNYSAADMARFVIAQRGTVVNARVAASAAAIALGDYLESAGNGTVRKHTAQAINESGSATVNIQANSVVAIATEAVDNSGGGTAVRIKALVL